MCKIPFCKVLLWFSQNLSWKRWGEARRGESEGEIKERWKQKLAGADQPPHPLPLFVLRQRCIIYRRWWTQGRLRWNGAKEASSPFLFCGSIPSGQALCWLDGCLWGNPGSYWAESEGRAWLTLAETQQHYSNTMSVTAAAREEKKKTERERVTEDRGNSGSVWFWQEGERRACFFFLWRGKRKSERNGRNELKKKRGGKARDEKKDGRGGRDRSSLQCSAALIYVYSWFCIIHKISWCNPVPRGGNGSPPSIHSVTTRFSSEPQQQVGDGCAVSGTRRTSATTQGRRAWRIGCSALAVRTPQKA